MSNRLPIPGQDNGTWGDILNSYLSVSHASDGTLNNNVVGTNQLQNNCVTNAQLDSPTQTAIAAVASKYVKPSGGIPLTDLSATGTPSNSTYLRGDNTWSTPAAGVTLDSTNTDIQALGTQNAGSSSQAAKADHVHPTTGLVLSSTLGAASGVATLNSSSQLTASQLPSSVVTGSSVTKTSTYTLTSSDHVVLADATSAAFGLTLPTAVGFSGVYQIDAISTGTNLVTVGTTSSQTIIPAGSTGATTVTLGTQASGAPYQAVELVSDGSNWRIV